LFRLSPK